MSITLKNADITLKLEKAGERYRGSRFDWNGLVSAVAFRGISLLGEEKPPFTRNDRIFGRGLHNEFGIKRCIGYDDCAEGDWFPKIGTGWLQKNDKPYFFYDQYPLEKLSFGCEVSGSSAAIFACDSGERNGYAYRYAKTVALRPDGFSLSYSLENTGSKPLATDEYVHNFLCIAGRGMDSGYSLEFPWTLDPARFGENVNPDGILRLEGKRVLIAGKTAKQFYLGGMSEGVGAKEGLAASWTLRDEKKKISLSEKGSFAPTGVHLWGWKSVISPELFCSFDIAPGNRFSWERVYTIKAL